ncbi:MAG: peptide chain release factor N(5)-glutamine methyltransferase [Clostridia bacterium]|nr:peptide chain release factor N(5)-glutamine methyltransferase [Clostridia bacterium]
MKLKEAYLRARTALSAVTDEAAREADLIFARFAGGKRPVLSPDEEIGEEALAAAERAVERRLKREPLQYILGSWGFMGLDFAVGPEALIPRQDTETLCEEALRLIKERGYETLLDICTGTGCIAVSLAKLGGVRAEASDISPDCVRLARQNAERNGVHLTVREADLFRGAGVYDVVTANPPYITDEDMASLQPEVAFEPALALAGGADGLDVCRRIAREADAHIRRGGALLMEVGAGEARAAAALFPGRTARIIKDLNGVERVVVVEF